MTLKVVVSFPIDIASLESRKARITKSGTGARDAPKAQKIYYILNRKHDFSIGIQDISGIFLGVHFFEGTLFPPRPARGAKKYKR